MDNPSCSWTQRSLRISALSCEVGESYAVGFAPSPLPRVTYSFLSFLGTVSYRIRILMYLDYIDVSCMYLDCILMCPVHIHQDTSRYIKIHLYLVVSGTLAVSYQGECILLLRYI